MTVLRPSTAIALLVAGTFFMENLDGTVIVTALPEMARSFGVHPIDLNVGVSAYLLTLAVLIPASGWMAERYGTRTIFSGAIAIFTTASVLCGFSQSLAGFTLARILQGAGGAMMVPVGRLAVLRTTEKHDLIAAIATITWPGLAAPVLGPPLGGFITTYATWHWIFFLNIPLGAVALLLAFRLLPPGREDVARPFDGTGFVLTGVACGAAIYGLDLVSRAGASRSVAGASLMVGLIAGWLAVRHARKCSQPLLDFRSLEVASYLVTVRGGSLFRIAIGAIPFLLPLLFQVGFGLTPFVSGLLTLSVFAGNLAMKPMSTAVMRRFSFRSTLLVNGVLNALAIAACAWLTPSTPVPVIVALLFVSGLSRSMQFGALSTLAFADVPKDRMGGANTLFAMAMQLALGMGIALGAVALRVTTWLAAAGPGDGIPLAAFQHTFLLIAFLALGGVVDILFLDRRAGDAVRRRVPE